MFDKFKKSEILILVLVVVLIFTSEYFYVVLNDPQRAIFIGLWPPTILGFLINVGIQSPYPIIIEVSQNATFSMILPSGFFNYFFGSYAQFLT